MIQTIPAQSANFQPDMFCGGLLSNMECYLPIPLGFKHVVFNYSITALPNNCFICLSLGI